jgi:aminopeptidase S
MKKLLLITAIISSSFNAFAHSDHLLWSTDKEAFEYTKRKLRMKPKVEIQLLSDSTLITIDKNFLVTKLKEFSGAVPVYINGNSVTLSERGSTKGIENALSYLSTEYQKLGYQTKIQEFGSYFSKGKNFTATKKGLDSSKVIIVSSHIDSVGNVGANDNGTGTIGTLAIAKALAPYQFKYDLRIVGFDKEEKGLVGSKQYVKSLSRNERSKILGVINFEMMGTNSRKDGNFHIIDCDRNDSTFLTRTMESVIGGHNIALKNVPGCTKRSDHASFWKANIPAIVISENFFGGDSDRCYHKSCDKFNSRLDFSYMEKITNAVASTTFQLLQVQR